MSSLEVAAWAIVVLLAAHLLVQIVQYGCTSHLRDHVIKRDNADSAEKRWRHQRDVERFICSDETSRINVAVVAMQGLLSDQREGSAWSSLDDKQLAERAYKYADAILAAESPCPST